MSRGRQHRGFRSIKEGSGIKQRKKIHAKMNLGQLMRKHRDLDEVLYPYLVSSDWIFEDMDLTIEEFSDISGADLEELLEEIGKVVKL